MLSIRAIEALAGSKKFVVGVEHMDACEEKMIRRELPPLLARHIQEVLFVLVVTGLLFHPPLLFRTNEVTAMTKRNPPGAVSMVINVR